MNPPNHYKYQMEQMFQSQRFDNYSQLANNDEFSKSFLMKKYLEWDDKEVVENAEGLKKDKELGFKEAEERY